MKVNKAVASRQWRAMSSAERWFLFIVVYVKVILYKLLFKPAPRFIICSCLGCLLAWSLLPGERIIEFAVALGAPPAISLVLYNLLPDSGSRSGGAI